MNMNNSAFEANQIDDHVEVIINREFDAGVKRDEWTKDIMQRFNGSYSKVVVNLGKCPIISSTVIAGLVHLHDFYGEKCPEGVVLRHCSDHVQNILKMMHLLPLFTLEEPAG